jgi:hypothetical protein
MSRSIERLDQKYTKAGHKALSVIVGHPNIQRYRWYRVWQSRS